MMAAEIVIPYGDIIVQACDLLFKIVETIAVVAIPAYVAKRFGPIAGMIVTEPMVRAQLDEARNVGINAVAGAAKHQTIQIKGVPEVVATGVNHMIARADVNKVAAYALRAAGGPEGAAKKIWAGLHLPADATAENSLAPALQKIVATKPAGR
jgi:hypothetical protein